MYLISFGFLGLLALSVPIAVILGVLAMWGLSNAGIPPVTVMQSALESLDSFALMAVPFYILAGNIMQAGGIAQRLVGLANALVGWMRGGLGASAVLTSMFFATISGSSSATAAAVGTITIPAMARKGYPRNFAAATVASAGELGAIIPPSLPMIIYALVTGTSVAEMFIAGILPGIMIGLSLILTVIVVANVKGFDAITKVDRSAWLRNVGRATLDAGPALFMPILILGGIYSGYFTPTEAAVVAVIYGLLVSTLLYREITAKVFVQILVRSALTASGLLLIVAFASGFGFFLTILQVPQQVSQWLMTFATSAIMFLLLVNVMLLIFGMVMETLAAIIILGPILAPIAVQFGIDPVHFGMIMIINLATGMVTPPVGVNLFVVCEVAKLRIDQLMRPLSIFLLVLITNIAIVTYFPAISTILIR